MPLYTVRVSGLTLTATTAKTIIGTIGAATRRHKLKRLQLSFSSVTATDAAVLVEICRSTQAGAGTATAQASTLIDPAETASITTAAVNYTAEPTTLTVIDTFYVSPIGNTFLWEIPNGREYIFALSTGCMIRCTSPATQTTNMGGAILFEE